MTKNEINELFDITDANTKVYLIEMSGNPFTDLSNHATADLLVSKVGGVFYASTLGTIDVSVATEIV